MLELKGKITAVRRFDGTNRDGEPYRAAECNMVEVGVEEGRFKNRVVFTLWDEEADKVKEGQIGTVEVRLDRKDIPRKDGSGTFTKIEATVPRGKGVWKYMEG